MHKNTPKNNGNPEDVLELSADELRDELSGRNIDPKRMSKVEISYASCASSYAASFATHCFVSTATNGIGSDETQDIIRWEREGEKRLRLEAEALERKEETEADALKRKEKIDAEERKEQRERERQEKAEALEKKERQEATERQERAEALEKRERREEQDRNALEKKEAIERQE